MLIAIRKNRDRLPTQRQNGQKGMWSHKYSEKFRNKIL